MLYIQTKFNKCMYLIYFLHLDVYLPRHLVEPFYNSCSQVMVQKSDGWMVYCTLSMGCFHDCTTLHHIVYATCLT